MDNVKVGRVDGYSGLGDWLMGPECKRLVEAKANEAMMLFQGIVAKRTGALARSVAVSMEVGGQGSDRWTGVMSVGRGIDYGLAHEFGYEHGHAHDDLNQVLTMLGTL